MLDIKLPENWSVKKVRGDGDCFFHAVAEGLNAQIKAEFPFEKLAEQLREKAETEFSTKLLRQICHRYALEQLEQLELTNSWLKKQIKKDTNRYKSLENYIARISYTAEDIKRKDSSATILGLKEVIWGDIVESRIICIVLDEIIQDSSKKVNIHIIEKQTVEGKEIRCDQIINEEGSKSINNVDYNDPKIIHIINGGRNHFDSVCKIDKQLQKTTEEDVKAKDKDEGTHPQSSATKPQANTQQNKEKVAPKPSEIVKVPTNAKSLTQELFQAVRKGDVPYPPTSSCE